MITYKLAKELKDAGFPYKGNSYHTVYPEGEPIPKYFMQRVPEGDRGIRVPTLSELIEACGDDFGDLTRETDDRWIVHKSGTLLASQGGSPEEAVAHLWLALNKEK